MFTSYRCKANGGFVMAMFKTSCTLITCLLLAATDVHAMTGNELLFLFRSTDVGDNLRAYDYVSGVTDAQDIYLGALAMIAYEWARDGKRMSEAKAAKAIRDRLAVCVPGEGVTREQVFDIVRQYLEANPATRAKPAATLVLESIGQAFRCAR